MKVNRLSRRQFLEGAGGALLSIPLLPCLLPRKVVEAMAAEPPKRNFIAFYSPDGSPDLQWMPKVRPKGTVGGVKAMKLTEISGNISDIITAADFDSIRNEINFIRGLDARAQTYHSADCMLAGVSLQDEDRKPELEKLWETLDTHIARSIYTGTPKVSQLVTATYNVDEIDNHVSYKKNGKYITPINALSSPRAIFDTLFKGVQASPAEGPTSGEPPIYGSILDVFLQDYRNLRGSTRISQAGKFSLDQHMDEIRKIELQIQRGPVVAGQGCVIPDRKDFSTDNNLERYSQSLEDASRFIDNYLNLFVAALKCQLTQVITFNWVSQGLNFDYYKFGDKTHHDLSHDRDPKGPDESKRKMANLQRFLAGKFAQFAKRLKSEIDPISGKNLLDLSFMMWGNEFSKCGQIPKSHPKVDFGILTAGSAGGRLTTGYLFDHRRPDVKKYYDWERGVLYNTFLLAIAQAFDVPASRYEINGQAGFGAVDTTLPNSDLYDLSNAGRRRPLPGFLK